MKKLLRLFKLLYTSLYIDFLLSRGFLQKPLTRQSFIALCDGKVSGIVLQVLYNNNFVTYDFLFQQLSVKELQEISEDLDGDSRPSLYQLVTSAEREKCFLAL